MNQEIQVLLRKTAHKYIDVHYAERLCQVDHASDLENLMKWAYSEGKADASQQINAADEDGQAVLEGVDYIVNNVDAETISLTRR